MLDWSKMVTGEELNLASKNRINEYEEIKVKHSLVNSYEEQGFVIESVMKTKTVMRRPREFSTIFENEVWQLFYKMGFDYLNYDNSFKVEYDGNSKQIDVLAINKEIIFVVECKASKTFEKKCNFKKEIESIGGFLPHISEELSEKFPGRRIKHIFAVKNYYVGPNDRNRLEALNSYLMEYDSLLYYNKLVDYLGPIAKFQLFGNVLQNTEIPNFEAKTYAIKGKMGNKTFYSFNIEPEKLLKMGYVLHRSSVNSKNAPTYQRIIKSARLKQVNSFVESGGFFPNNLICSINGDVDFKPISSEITDSMCEVGVLTLPKKYMSIYIIDGQHRLYGYSSSNHAKTDLLNCLAFLENEKEDGLTRMECVKMFMDVNENQKQVSKTLKNTLLVDLLWDSNSEKDKRTALNIRIAEGLGINHDSPLYNRVLIGEEVQTELRVITTEYIKNGLIQGDFLNKYKNNGSISTVGIFDFGDNNTSYDKITDFLIKCFNVIVDRNKEEWDKGSNGFLSLNNTVYGLIRIFSDVVKLKQEGLPGDDIFDKCKPMIEKLADAITRMNDEEKTIVKKSYGGGGKNTAYRTLQIVFNKSEPEYINDDLKNYIESISTDNNEKVAPYIEPLKEYFKKLFADRYDEKDLQKNFSDTYIMLNQAVVNKKIENSRVDVFENVDLWDVASFDAFEMMAKKESTSNIISLVTIDENKTTKKEICNWFALLGNVEQALKDNRPVSKMDYEIIEGLYNTFVASEGEDE